MKLFSKSMLVAVATGTLVFSACHDKDLYEGTYQDDLTDKTADNFKEMVGDIDQSQTWETVKNVEVNLPINYGTGDIFNVVYYANGKVVGATTIADGSTLTGKVSVPSYTTEISVSLTTQKGLGTIIKVPVDGSGAQKAPTRATMRKEAGISGYSAESYIEYTNPVKYARVYPGEYEKSNWGNWGNSYATGSKTPYVWPHTFYYVENAINGIVNPLSENFLNKVGQLLPENALPADTRATIVQDYSLVMAEDGPVKLRYVSGVSQNQAAIGYFIYKDDPDNLENMDISEDALVDILKDKYKDSGIIYYSGENYWSNSGEITENPTATLSDLKTCNKYVVIEDMKNAGLENGSEIQLTYYDEDGNPSAYFPKGTRIGFFIIPSTGNVADHNTGYIDTRRAVYSLSKMNVEPHQSGGEYFYYGWDGNTYATSHVATFKVGNDIVVGFEDANNYNSADYDYNDFVFTISGDFTPDIPELPDPSPEPEPEPEPEPDVQMFTYCFEDKDVNGGDYDFNDVVLKVSAPLNGKISITLAAAGGTYGVKAGLDDKSLFDGRELHDVFGVATNIMVNTGAGGGEGTTLEPVTIELEVGDSWNIADNGNFWIDVIDRGISVMIPQFTPGFVPGDVPYAIRIAEDFDFPQERQKITDKYPDFATWAHDATQAIDWYTK